MLNYQRVTINVVNNLHQLMLSIWEGLDNLHQSMWLKTIINPSQIDHFYGVVMKHSVLENVPSSWMILPRESSHCSGVLPEHSLEIPSGKSQLETLIWSYPDDVLPPPLTRAYYPPRPSPSMASTMAFSIAQLMSCRWIYRPTKKKTLSIDIQFQVRKKTI